MKVAITCQRCRFDDPEEARKLLSEIYERFTEGFDTPDLQDTKALLNVL